MSRDDLIALMRNAWVGNEAANLHDVDAAGNKGPPTAKQLAMLDAQLGAVADGIIAALSGGVPGSSPEWVHPQVGAGAAGAVFTLPYAPISVPGTFIVLNGQLLEGWTISGRTLTLPEPKTADDVLTARYQAVVLT